MTNSNLEKILKGVSRSFYLSMRILPGAMRTPISVAYLLARAADNLVDNEKTPYHLRVAYLHDILSDLKNASSSRCNKLSESLWLTIDNPTEQLL
ncbi:MAG: squalene/phytoene synthase family protein, partial [Thiohalomonadales bacterium]